MSKRLYVGSLPYETTEDQLRELFASCGTIESVAVISDKFTGRSKGFGFVEFANDDEAKAAMESLNGTTVGSRQIVVNEARPTTDKRSGGGSGGGRRGGGFGGGRREGGNSRDRDNNRW